MVDTPEDPDAPEDPEHHDASEDPDAPGEPDDLGDPEPAATGRHGGSGMSAAEIIARARAADPAAASRPSRSARRAAEQAEALAERVEAATDEPSMTRHLAVVASPVPLIEDLPVAVRTSRAGRNLPAAIGVGAGLGALVLASVFLYRPSFAVILVIAAAIGVYEMVQAISTVEARPPLVPLVVGGVAMDAAAWFRGPDGLVGALLLTVLGVVVWRLADGAAGYLPDVASGVFIALYVPFLAGFAALMVHPDDGAARIVMFILAVVCSDTGGYAAGVLFGKHPMAPTVSPKKSWEGFAGSLVGSSISGSLLMVFCFHHEWWKGVIFGLAIAVTATLGDLGESMIKRDLGLKDMGKLLPGHGGIMDRLDSLLPCAPVAYLLLAAFVPH
ncbi:phosphatidate cytidylyltransferase [Jatrophihabitans telluris]|uniref:Phosphatidate cytidylyltransferase n=1 Tax=Jatrophihabitans telluris TaxID=2038343 RepID=A0ABY4R4Z4_9ACTN|nr:phosphatidate cytidylyltransferase [Jatrophihabitans telluris]UQX90015.1 phosphatidate cytidylyltransferase [Jatrophihabitans telluris]